MNNSEVEILIVVYLIVMFVALLWKINDNYKENSKKYTDNSKGKNLINAVKDFLNSDGIANRGFLPILFFIVIAIIVPIMYIGISAIKLLPPIAIYFLTILSGFVVFVYFLIMIKDTAKSIKKEKFKTTIKTRLGGFIAFFIFIICFFAYI